MLRRQIPPAKLFYFEGSYIFMEKYFGTLPSGLQATLYTICCGRMMAAVTDFGAALVQLRVDGTDVVLGYDDACGYNDNDGFLGATVGRNANRIRLSRFDLNGNPVILPANEGKNNLHSGPDPYARRIWKTEQPDGSTLHFFLHSPDGDQGFPGNADIRVTYHLTENALTISYDAVSDRDTVFNFTNHSYFNLFGEDHPEQAMDQLLTIPGRWFNPDDAENIPTGEQRCVEGTPFDFRREKPLGRDIEADYEPLHLQGGYDHNFEAASPVCAVVRNPENGLTMRVSTTCPGVQIYTANFLDVVGKQGRRYPRRSGVAIETQFAPDSVNHPEWPQPFVKAGVPYHSETTFSF